jgi:hypothetical protein
MSTFGKVLAVFNVLAAIGFVFVAAKDYYGRQSWAYSHFRHELAIHGLPVDDKDDSWRLPGNPISESFGADARKDLFGTADGPKTQVDEVIGTVAAFRNGVNSAADIGAKRDLIAKYLLPQLTRADERDQVIRELQNLKDQAGVDALVGRFDAMATRATNLNVDRETRRRAIADFLYNFEYSDQRHARVQKVIGLDQYVAAAERQTGRLQEMIARNKSVVAHEQAAFVTQYQAVLPELTALSARLEALEARLVEQKDLVQRHTADRNARQTEVTNLTNELNAEKQTEAREVASLAAIERELFAVQQDVAKARAKTEQLERDLRTKETAK